MVPLADLLAEKEVFRKLPRDERVALADLAKQHTYIKGQFICQQGDVCPSVIHLAWGRAEIILLSSEGRRRVMFEYSRGDTIWALSLFDDLPLPASIQALEDCVAHMWPREVILPTLLRHPEALWDLCCLQTRTQRRFRESYYSLAFQSVTERLASLLLRRYGGASTQPVPRDLTLDEMASQVGTTPELVCRVLYRFVDEGMIELSRTTLRILDRPRLEEMLDGHR